MLLNSQQAQLPAKSKAVNILMDGGGAHELQLAQELWTGNSKVSFP